MNAECLCGGIRIELSGRIGPVVYCHCSRCRKASGTAFAANADVRRKYWRFVAGEDLIHEFESSPGVFRAFCGRCGSPIYSRRPETPDVLRISSASSTTTPAGGPSRISGSGRRPRGSTSKTTCPSSLPARRDTNNDD